MQRKEFPYLTFGENLKLLREKAYLTQEQLAKYLHITHQTISKWENDISQPSINYCVPLSKILKCSLHDIFKIYEEKIQ